MKTIKPVILAAGKGVRMKSDGPKVLVPLRGKPMIGYLLEAIGSAGLAEPPIIVIGYEGEKVKQALGPKYHYVVQDRQLGTGHAVATAIPHIAGKDRHVIVLYGDHALVSKETIVNLTTAHLKGNNAVTMGTVSIPDFKDENLCFFDYGRIIRDKGGSIIGSVETKDATEKQKMITEVNPCYYCFNAGWLKENIKKLANKNAQSEYYLTDLVHIACKNGDAIGSISIPPRDAMGANTLEQLKTIEALLDS